VDEDWLCVSVTVAGQPSDSARLVTAADSDA